MKIKKIISESIRNYVDNIILEDSEFNYTDNPNPRNEIIEYLKYNSLDVEVGEHDIEFETENYFFHIEYGISSNVMSKITPSNDYDVPDSYDLIDEDDWDFDYIDIIYYDDDNNQQEVECDDELMHIIKNKCNIDYDGYDIPSSEDMEDDNYEF